MILELAAIASTVAGALLLRKKSTDEETKTDYAPDVEVEEAPEGEFEPVVEEPAPEPEPAAPSAPADPRDGELYLGDKSQPYDPFYDYSKGGIYAMSKYQLSSIEGNDETLAQAYRMRIVRPFFAFEKASRPKTWNGLYRNNGLPMQTLQKGSKFLNVMPFYRGDYSRVRFLLEVFNPFDFDAPLQKLRISAVSSGGKECYIIPPEVPDAYNVLTNPPELFDPYFSSRRLLPTLGDIRFAYNAFSCYHSHYQYRFGATDEAMDDSKPSGNLLPYQPSDFEIITAKDYHTIVGGMKNFAKNQFKPGTRDANGYTRRDLNPTQADYYAKNISKMLGAEISGSGSENTFLAQRVPVYEGMKHPLDGCSEYMTIPARGSVMLEITLPVAGSVIGKYWKQDHVYNKTNPSNTMIDSMKWNYCSDWQKNTVFNSKEFEFHPLGHIKGMDKTALHHLIYYSGLGEGYNNKKDNKGGFLFIDTTSVDTFAESDFRMKIAAYSDKKQSVIEGSKSGDSARSGFSSPFFEVGMYRGGRPLGSEEWWKSYWENVECSTAENSIVSDYYRNMEAAGVDVDQYERNGYDEWFHLDI